MVSLKKQQFSEFAAFKCFEKSVAYQFMPWSTRGRCKVRGKKAEVGRDHRLSPLQRTTPPWTGASCSCETKNFTIFWLRCRLWQWVVIEIWHVVTVYILQFRSAHVKRCGRKYGISPKNLMSLMDTQASVAAVKVMNGASHTRFAHHIHLSRA